jgi:hypothetical protein
VVSADSVDYMLVPTTSIKGNAVPNRRGGEVSTVDPRTVQGPTDQHGMCPCSVAVCVVGRPVKAVRAEWVPVEVGLTPAASNVFIAAVHLARLQTVLQAVVVERENRLTAYRHSDRTSYWEPSAVSDNVISSVKHVSHIGVARSVRKSLKVVAATSGRKKGV